MAGERSVVRHEKVERASSLSRCHTEVITIRDRHVKEAGLGQHRPSETLIGPADQLLGRELKYDHNQSLSVA